MQIDQPLLSIQIQTSLINASLLQIALSSKIIVSKYNKIAIMILYWSNQIIYDQYIKINQLSIDFNNHPTTIISTTSQKINIIQNYLSPILSYNYADQIQTLVFISSIEMQSLNNITNKFKIEMGVSLQTERSIVISIKNQNGLQDKLKVITIFYIVYNNPQLIDKGIRISAFYIDNLMNNLNRDIQVNNMMNFNTFYGFSSISIDNLSNSDIQISINTCISRIDKCLKFQSDNQPLFTKLSYFTIQTNYCSYYAPYFLTPNQCHKKCPKNYKNNTIELTCQCNLFKQINNKKTCIANSSNLPLIDKKYYYFQTQPPVQQQKVNKPQEGLNSVNILLIVCVILALLILFLVIFLIIMYKRRKAKQAKQKRNKQTQQLYTIQNISQSKITWLTIQSASNFNKSLLCLLCQNQKIITNFQLNCGHQYHLNCYIRHFSSINKPNCKNQQCAKNINNNYNFGLFYCQRCQNKYCLINYTDKIFKEYQQLGEIVLLTNQLKYCDQCCKNNNPQ